MSIYACSDLHGNLNIYNQIKEFLKPEDELVFLGDAADRGPHGFEIIKDILKNKEQFHYLKGNHEDMLVNALESQLEYADTGFSSTDDLMLLFSNGGKVTFYDIYDQGLNYMKEIKNHLKKLPTEMIIKNKNGINIICCHSGCLKDPLWDRKHYLKNEKIDENTVIVHGHTPIMYMYNDKKIKEAPYFYNNNQKINIDCGTAFTKTTILLDLDTFDAIEFKERI